MMPAIDQEQITMLIAADIEPARFHEDQKSADSKIVCRNPAIMQAVVQARKHRYPAQAEVERRTRKYRLATLSPLLQHEFHDEQNPLRWTCPVHPREPPTSPYPSDCASQSA